MKSKVICSILLVSLTTSMYFKANENPLTLIATNYQLTKEMPNDQGVLTNYKKDTLQLTTAPCNDLKIQNVSAKITCEYLNCLHKILQCDKGSLKNLEQFANTSNDSQMEALLRQNAKAVHNLCTILDIIDPKIREALSNYDDQYAYDKIHKKVACEHNYYTELDTIYYPITKVVACISTTGFLVMIIAYLLERYDISPREIIGWKA